MAENRATPPSSVSAPSEQEGSDHRPSGARRRVLVCEDDEGIRQVLLEAIEGEGLVAHVARDGREALEALRHGDGRFLVLLDLIMPEVSGFEILDLMNADPQLRGEHIVVVISATGFIRPLNPGIIEKQLIKATLSKPFELDDLLALLHRWA